jgi:hypothetical protein
MLRIRIRFWWIRIDCGELSKRNIVENFWVFREISDLISIMLLKSDHEIFRWQLLFRGYFVNFRTKFEIIQYFAKIKIMKFLPTGTTH